MSDQIFISLMNPAIAFFFAFIFAVISKRLPSQTYLFPLWVAFVYLGLGFATQDFRVLTPLGGINYAGNALLLTAVALACASVLMRCGKQVPLALFALVFAASTAIFLWSSWIQPSLLGRIIAMSTGFTGFAVITLWLILGSGITSLADRLLAGGVSLALVVAVARPALVIHGVLDINPEGDFRDSTYWETVRAFTPLMSISVASLFLFGVVSDLIEQMRGEAGTDYLTGLLNRRGFALAVEPALSGPEQQAARPALLLADIDDFKKVNDAFGHNIGDRVIASVARVLSAHGGAAFAGRIGGEEFALFYDAISRDTLRQMARDIQTELRHTSIAGLPNDFPLTISIGLHMREGTEPLPEMLAGADRALYRAKSQGKNTAVLNPVRLGIVGEPAPNAQSLSA